MSFFRYTVKNSYGETLKGRVEAQTAEQAALILRNRSLLVISVKQADDELFAGLKSAMNGVKQNEIVNFTRQLATMITAGLTLTESLTILQQQSKGAFAKVVSDLQREIEGGSTFAKALSAQGKLFSPVFVQLVRAGEAAGALDNVLNRLADTLEKEKEFRSKTRGALIYPVIVIIVMIIVAFVMMIFVIPKISQMYKELGAKLPFLTQALINVSTFMATYWYLVIGMAVGGWLAFRAWTRTLAGRRRFDRFLLRMPIMGPLRQKVVLTEFCRTMGLLLSSGISMLQGLEILAKAVDNKIYQEALEDSRQDVEKGMALSQSIGRFPEFPPILSQMIAVGEETGKIDEVLLKLSLYFEAESEQAVKNLTTAFEPAIMLILGLGVGLLVIAIILPIYNITQSFG